MHMLILGASRVVKIPAANAGNIGFIPGSGRSPGIENGNSLHFLPGKSHGQRCLACYSPWGHRVWHDWATEHKNNMLTLTLLLCLCWGSRQCGLALFIFILFPNFHWEIFNLKCCVSFRCTVKWVNYTNISQVIFKVSRDVRHLVPSLHGKYRGKQWK